MNGQTFVFADPDAVAEESARRLTGLMAERPNGRFSLALSGGSTPQRFYRLLTTPPWRGQIDWGRLHVFLADERFLPLDHPDSNFRMVRETLVNPVNNSAILNFPLTPNVVELSRHNGGDCRYPEHREVNVGAGSEPAPAPWHLGSGNPCRNDEQKPVSTALPLTHPLRQAQDRLLQRGEQEKLPKSNLHPIPTDGTVEECAVRYETELRNFFGSNPPRFDLIVLGMGPDGHTASLFPGHVHPHGHWVLTVHHSPKPPPTRLSLSLEVINQAHQVLFLVTGQDKAEALANLRNDSVPKLPAGTVQLDKGELVWLVDEAAGGEKQ